MSHIINNIYLGSIYDAGSSEFLKTNNIKTIVSLINDETTLNVNTATFKHHRYCIEDFPTEANKLFNFLPEIYDIIELATNNKTNILIHCMVGASRSATAVIYYIMRKYNIKSFEKVYQKVKSRRNVVNLNSGFKEVLTKFEQNLVIDYKLPEENIDDIDDMLQEFLFTKK
jgi:protein-tyrosine phosphatase